MKRSAGNFFEYFFVSGSSNQRVEYKYGNQNVTKNFPVVCHGYVKYEESEVYRSAIMQDFQDNEKKKADWRPFWILLVRSFIWVTLVRPYILF